jgi:hypothetical protein
MLARYSTALLGAVVLSLPAAFAQDDAEDVEPLRCLSMASIRSTKIVDDGTVLFYHGRGRVYVNRLERQCVGLTRQGKFTYQVQTGARHARLCATDTITVLERTGRGFNCDLGMFEPISRERADGLLAGPNRAVSSAPVELPAEEPPSEPAADAPPGPEPPPAPEPAER